MVNIDPHHSPKDEATRKREVATAKEKLAAKARAEAAVAKMKGKNLVNNNHK